MADNDIPNPGAIPGAVQPPPPGSATPPAPGGTPPPPPPPAPGGDEGQLGDAGKRALDSERTARRAAEAERDRVAAELEQYRQAQMTEQEKAVEAARKAGRDEATTEVNTRLLRAEVTAVAAGKAADPGDVVAILASEGKLATLQVDDHGQVDRAAIGSMIDDLLKAKPHLAAVRDPGFGNRQPANSGSNAGRDMNDWLRSQARR